MADERVERDKNTHDEATLSNAIALNDTTSTTIQALNKRRTFFSVSNPDNKDIWLKLQSAGTDDDKKGIFIPRGGYWEMPVDNIFTGEISAISKSGSPDAFTTEY